jgi:RimJ/RimL family protein N-acetyltransferase
MIQGQKIRLRPVEKEDLPLLYKWRNDEDVFRFLGGGFQPISQETLSNQLNSMVDMYGKDRRFIILDENCSAIGFIGLYDINWIHRTSEIGIYIGEKTSHGKGYGKDSVQALEAYAKNYLNIRKIKLNVVENNRSALKFWMSLGYEIIGTYHAERYIGGQFHNVVIMEKFISIIHSIKDDMEGF